MKIHKEEFIILIRNEIQKSIMMFVYGFCFVIFLLEYFQYSAVEKFSPKTSWYGLDTFQYVEQAQDRLLPRPPDNNRHPLISLIHWGPLKIFTSLGISPEFSLSLYVSIVSALWLCSGYLFLRVCHIRENVSILGTIFASFSGPFLFSSTGFETLALGALSVNVSLILSRLIYEFDFAPTIKVVIAVLSVTIPLIITVPLCIVPFFYLFYTFGFGRTLSIYIYSVGTASVLFSIQSFAFKPTPFFLDRPWSGFVNENDPNYWLFGTLNYLKSIFLLPEIDPVAKTPTGDLLSVILHEPLINFSADNIVFFIIISLIIIRLKQLPKLNRLESVAPLICLIIINASFGREPHWQTPFALFIFLQILVSNNLTGQPLLQPLKILGGTRRRKSAINYMIVALLFAICTFLNLETYSRMRGYV